MKKPRLLTAAEGAVICHCLEEGGLWEPLPTENREQQSQVVADYLNRFVNQIARGYQVILREVEKQGGAKRRDQFVIHDAMLKVIKKQGGVTAALEKEGTLQGALNFSGAMMGEMYDIALSLAAAREYDEAISVFYYLTYLNPYVSYFWQELGRCWRELQRWDDALYAFSVGINCDPCDPDNYRNAINLCVETKRLDTAKDILNYGLELIQAAENVEHRVERLERLNNMLAYVASQH